MIKAEIPWDRQPSIGVKKGDQIKGTASGNWKVTIDHHNSKWYGPDGNPISFAGSRNDAELHYRINNNEPQPAGKNFNFIVPENGTLKFWCRGSANDVLNNMGRMYVTLTKSEIIEKRKSTHPKRKSSLKAVSTSPHMNHSKKYEKLGYKTEAQWDKHQKIVHVKANNAKPVKRLKNFKVFGWHPYYKGTAFKSYDFSVLWGVTYFAYFVDPHTGGFTSIHNWKTTEMVEDAKKGGCKVFLSATNFGHHKNRVFLNNGKAQEKFIKTIIQLLDFRKADGLNLDFEEVPGKLRRKFSDFLIKLSTRLKRKKYMLTLAVYAIDFEKVFEIERIKEYIDLFIIMGYDYHYAGSHNAGPVSPLKSGNEWVPDNIETSVDYYLGRGVPHSKLLLAVPYYGREWRTSTYKFPSKNMGYLRSPSYTIIKKFDHVKNAKLDPLSNTKYCVYQDAKGNYRQLWFDDEETLGKKYDWIKKKKIEGVGIWALGYDNGYTELWDLLKAKFCEKK